MQWQDDALVLAVRPLGESALVAHVFGRQQGRAAGLIRGSKRRHFPLQQGVCVQAQWKGRLAEHLGTLSYEIVEQPSPLIYDDARKLAALTSLCGLLELCFPEHDPHPAMFDTASAWIAGLGEDPLWEMRYVLLELQLIKELGFGLDLATCVATGSHENLIYVSPKSGRAVSEDAGRPYHDKLLKLPRFFLNEPEACQNGQDIQAGLKLTGFFLAQGLKHITEKTLPAARERFCDMVR